MAVLLPVTALAIAAAVLLSERYHTAQEASGIAGEIPALTGIVRLRTLLDQERIPAEASLRASELGVHLPRAVGALGLTIAPESAARAAVDAQLRAHPALAPVGFVGQLDRLRREIDGGRIDARGVDRGFANLSNELASTLTRRLSALERRLANTSHAAALTASLRTLSTANEVLAADAAETAEVSNLYLDEPALKANDLGALGGQVALLDSASTRLRSDSSGQVHAAFTRLEDSPFWQEFQAAAAAAAAPPPRAPAGRSLSLAVGSGASISQVQVPRLIALFASGLSGVRQLYRLIGLAELDTGQVAARLEAASTSAYRTLVIQTIFGVGLTIAVALLLARSISRPLRRLEGHARAVGNGELELAPLPERGPKETAIATRAFNDLVSNLRLLETKTRLLAECAFADPRLNQRLPGRLGHALQQSVAVLSGSIVERDRLQQSLAHQATHDPLTGLHNRAAAVEFLDQAITRTSRASRALAVLFIDLDDFKRANDTHGHAVGDQVLKTIAKRMSEGARGADFLARLGGDEFVVIAEGVGDASQASALATRLIEAAGEPVEAGGVRISIGACVGIAFALDGGADDASQLLARADLALYRAKHAANSRVEIYDESLQQVLIERAEIEKELHAALDHGGAGLSLELQPVIDAASGELAWVEALVRWRRPGHGACLPNEFIPAAEASDLIVRLDCWVLAAALAQQREWRRRGLPDVGVSVNISGRHLLSGRLVEHVTAALRDADADPSRLTLELTETVLLTDLPTVGVEMQRLRSLGVRVSIDDFGTGFTSLAHLQHLTVDEIKIDRSYVQQLPDGHDSPLVRMVTQAGHHLGVSIVAEGVETAEQLAALRDIGCDALQGYLIARPLPVEQLLAWERRRGRRPRELDAAV